jgi:multicomponent Na+:H+ antiporter subunit C
VTYLPYLLAVWIFLVGIFGIITSRNFIHLVVCLSVTQSSTYVLLLAVGYVKGGTAPIFKDVKQGVKTVDPVVQALTLTDIVVSVTIAALLLSLAILGKRHARTMDPEKLRPMRG